MPGLSAEHVVDLDRVVCVTLCDHVRHLFLALGVSQQLLSLRSESELAFQDYHHRHHEGVVASGCILLLRRAHKSFGHDAVVPWCVIWYPKDNEGLAIWKFLTSFSVRFVDVLLSTQIMVIWYPKAVLLAAPACQRQ